MSTIVGYDSQLADDYWYRKVPTSAFVENRLTSLIRGHVLREGISQQGRSRDDRAVTVEAGAAMSTDVTTTAEWQALQAHAEKLREAHLRDLFATDPQRGDRLAVQVADLYVDFSKNLVTDETFTLLTALADRVGLADRIAAMFAPQHINTSEDRPVLHTALRLPRDAELVVDGQDVVADVHAVLDRMGAFAERVRSGRWRGHTGERITTVVNIGIGGSALGPVMACEALQAYPGR